LQAVLEGNEDASMSGEVEAGDYIDV